MSQSKRKSLEETIVNTASGFLVSLMIQLICFPWFGIKITMGENLLLTGIFTVASIVRGYAIRRVYNKFHVKRLQSDR